MDEHQCSEVVIMKSISEFFVLISLLMQPDLHILNSEICRNQRIGEVSPAAYVTFTQIQRHGFVSNPPSRVYLCKLGLNSNCGRVQYEPQSVEAHKGFPKNGPVDGHIAGGGRFNEVDESGVDRWKMVSLGDYLRTLNESHVVLELTWSYTAVHRTSAYHLFGTTASYNVENPLKRESLKHLHSVMYINTRKSDEL